jgi:hypothetical protein
MRLSIPIIALCAVLAGGCASSPETLQQGPAYPAALARTQPSNIQLVRTRRHVEMTNTTARGFGPSRIWLNQWYSAPIDGLGVGESIRLPLTSFRDEFGASFRGGGFFAAEAPDRLVKAELELDPAAGAGLVPLIVVGDRP